MFEDTLKNIYSGNECVSLNYFELPGLQVDCWDCLNYSEVSGLQVDDAGLH